VLILRFEIPAVAAGRLKWSFRWRLVLTAGQLTVRSWWSHQSTGSRRADRRWRRRWWWRRWDDTMFGPVTLSHTTMHSTRISKTTESSLTTRQRHQIHFQTSPVQFTEHWKANNGFEEFNCSNVINDPSRSRVLTRLQNGTTQCLARLSASTSTWSYCLLLYPWVGAE
jgi:hypothetical protein